MGAIGNTVRTWQQEEQEIVEGQKARIERSDRIIDAFKIVLDGVIQDSSCTVDYYRIMGELEIYFRMLPLKLCDYERAKAAKMIQIQRSTLIEFFRNKGIELPDAPNTRRNRQRLKLEV